MNPSFKLSLALLGLALAASCRNGEPRPIVPTAPIGDGGPERTTDGGLEPVGPLAGAGSARDAASDGP